ncbi:MAG: hypothetical protein ACI9W4_001501 [Rhodothermales bacterium]|jgi:hypothetical protein
MDSILPIVALVAFYIFRALTDKKRKSMPPPPDDSGVPVDGRSSDMQEALAEIREALGMGEPTSTDAPTEVVVAPPASEGLKRTSAPRRANTPTRIADSAARTSAPAPQTSDEFHRVVTRKPEAKSTFQSRREDWDAREKAKTDWPSRTILTSAIPTEESFESGGSTFRDPLRDHDHIPLKAVSIAAKPRRRRLRTPSDIREAIITAEILGPPKSLRHRK